MLTLPPQNNQEFELTPAGSFVAVCYRAIDLGTQLIEFKGESKRQHKIMLSWELCDEFMKHGKNEGLPFSIHKRYTFSSHEKSSLINDLQAWRGKAFTPEEFGNFSIAALMGVGCMIGVVHKESNNKTFANIGSIMKLPKGVKCTPPINPTVCFDLKAFDQVTYDNLSESLRATIALSPEYQELKGMKADRNVSDDSHDPAPTLDEESIPF